jgi:hypothetical protein
MKRIYFILFMLWVARPGCCQQKKINIPVNKYWDSARWKDYLNRDTDDFGLKNLYKNNDLVHFRISTDIYAVDIWTNDHKTFGGSFSVFTSGNSYRGLKRKKPNKNYCRTKPLDTATAAKIYRLFQSQSVFSIPPQDSIKGWNMGDDGEDCNIEYSTPTYYSAKFYWTPEVFPTLHEAITINYVWIKLYNMLDMENEFGNLIHSLPAGAYSAGGNTYVTTVIRN